MQQKLFWGNSHIFCFETCYRPKQQRKLRWFSWKLHSRVMTCWLCSLIRMKISSAFQSYNPTVLNPILTSNWLSIIFQDYQGQIILYKCDSGHYYCKVIQGHAKYAASRGHKAASSCAALVSKLGEMQRDQRDKKKKIFAKLNMKINSAGLCDGLL